MSAEGERSRRSIAATWKFRSERTVPSDEERRIVEDFKKMREITKILNPNIDNTQPIGIHPSIERSPAIPLPPRTQKPGS